MRESERTQGQALVQAGLILASELSLPVVLQKIVELACSVADARYGALGVLTDSGEEIRDFITYGVTEEERRRIGHLPHGKGILGVLIHDGHPLRLKRIQDDPRSAGFPSNHPHMTSFLGVPVKIGGSIFGNLYLTEKRGAPEFTADDQEAVETLATQAAVAIKNARLYDDAQVRQQRLTALNEVTAAILEGEETLSVLRRIARHARELVGADLATIATPDPENAGLVLSVAEGADSAELEGSRFPRDGSISGDVMRERAPLVVADASNDTHARQPIVGLGKVGAAIFVPLHARDRTFGTLLVGNLKGRPAFTADDLAFLQTFAAQAAVALEYARLQEELQRLAVLEDRERIAKELHDGVVQSLFAVGMALQATESMIANDDVQRRLENAVDDIDRVIRDLRSYIFGLHPGQSADFSLERAIHELAEGFRKGTSTAIVTTIEDNAASRLAGRAANIVQATREALSNAVRHAGATRIEVSLRGTAREAILEVRDDGRGFDPASPSNGQGMTTLRARAEALGGTIEITSSAGNGSLIRITIPT